MSENFEAIETAAVSEIPAEQRLSACRKTFKRLGLAVLLMVVITLVVGMLGGAFFPQFSESIFMIMLMSVVPTYFVALPLAWLFIRKLPVAVPEKKSMKLGGLLTALIISLFFMYVGNLAGNGLSALLRSLFKIPANDAIQSMLLEGSVVMVIFATLIAPVLEELVFRKILIDRMSVFGEKLAVICSALVFCLFHQNLNQVFYTFGMGLVMGYVYLRTGKIGYTMLLHVAINAMGSIVAPALAANPNLAIVMIIYMLAVLVAGLILLLRVRRKLEFKEAQMELPKGKRFKTAILNVGMLLFIICTLAVTVINAVFA